MKTTVVNRYHGTAFDVNIMRPGPWGNPFKNGTREENVSRYRAWLHAPEQAGLRERARLELRGKVLACCCKPLACHGDVLAAYVDQQPRLTAPRHRFYTGHVIDVLEALKPGSVRCAITSPPYYGLRAYGTQVQVWGGRAGCSHDWTGYLRGKRQRWGDVSTLSQKQKSNRGSRANVEALERDGGRVCKTCNAYEGELGQEPTAGDYARHVVAALEPLRLRVLAEDGTLFLNLGDSSCYGAEGDCKPKDLFGVPWEVAFALRRRGWYLRNAIVWVKPNGFPSSSDSRFTPTYEMLFMLTKNPEYYFDFESVMEPATDTRKRPDVRNFGRNPHRRDNYGSYTEPRSGLRRRRDVWTIPTKGYRHNGIHYATFPEALVEPCMLAGSAEGDTVLDPFGGIGTVAAVAKRLGRRSISIDLKPEYSELAQWRVRHA
jgi:DNA modification methylase